MVLDVCVAAAAVLLAVAGLAKLRTPGPAAAMLVLVWPGLRPLRRARRVARVAGTVELGTALAVLVAGDRIALGLLAACYLVLTLVALRLAFGVQRSACGCFGAADGEVGLPHVLLDLACLGVTVAALTTSTGGGVSALFGGASLTGTLYLGQALLLASLGYLAITALPALSVARRTVEGRT